MTFHPSLSGKQLLQAMTLWTIAAITALSAGCSSGHATKEELRHARDNGHARALEFSATARMDSLKMEMQLLDIRERETRLRANGYDDAADAFMESFLATLDSVNPALASELRE